MEKNRCVSYEVSILRLVLEILKKDSDQSIFFECYISINTQNGQVFGFLVVWKCKLRKKWFEKSSLTLPGPIPEKERKLN